MRIGSIVAARHAGISTAQQPTTASAIIEDDRETGLHRLLSVQAAIGRWSIATSANPPPIPSGYAASHRAIRELKATGLMSRRVRVRSSKCLNNVVEQDHRRVKQRIGPMLGFKRFDTAAITIRGIELAEKIKKVQFKVGKLPIGPAIDPEFWILLAS